MGKIIAISNQKGGVGKTTTSINLAAGLAYMKKKVLLIDFDSQGNATQGIGARKNLEYTVYDMLLKGVEFEKCVIHIQKPPMDVIGANFNLAGSDIEMSNHPDKEQLLKKQLEKIRDLYDFIIIDCPPSLNLLNTNALTAADSILVPVQCEYLSLEGLTQLLATIRMIQKTYNPRLVIEGVLLTMYDSRTRLSTEIQQEVRKYFKEKVYSVVIPRNIKLSEAPSNNCTIFEHALNSEGAHAYAALAKELIKNNPTSKE